MELLTDHATPDRQRWIASEQPTRERRNNMRYTKPKQTKTAKQSWLKWLQMYTAEKFLDSFLANVENAEGTCTYCGEKIYVDVLVGGGVPDWSTECGDFGCGNSPDTTDEGCGGHMPRKRGD
jgi:hypothetical protein